jgi:ferredoxin
MPLTSGGRIYACPCCALAMEYGFKEETLLTLNPGQTQAVTNGNIPALTRTSRKVRVCRQCGYCLDIADDHEANKWAKMNAARLKTLGPIISSSVPVESQCLERVPVNPSKSTSQFDPNAPLQIAATAANGAPTSVPDDVDLSLMSDVDDDETVPPSAVEPIVQTPASAAAARPRAAATR